MSELMATLRPRRGTRQAAIDNNIILKSGEIYFEVPADGVGTGKGNIVIGNGTSAYEDLPYFATNVTVNDTLTSTSSTEALSAKQGKVLLDRIAELEATIETLQTKLTSAEGNISTLSGKVTTAESDISTLQSGLSTTNTNVSTLSGKMTTAETNISTLQTKMTSAEGNISTLQSGLSTTNTNVSTLSGKMTSAEGNISTLQTQLSELSASLGDQVLFRLDGQTLYIDDKE